MERRSTVWGRVDVATRALLVPAWMALGVVGVLEIKSGQLSAGAAAAWTLLVAMAACGVVVGTAALLRRGRYGGAPPLSQIEDH
jgi:hypothetical protein